MPVEEVEKRSGKTEPFVREKIVVACVKAGASPEEARRIADLVADTPDRRVRSETIRGRVLKELGRSSPSARDSWLSYDKSRGRALPQF